MISFKLEISISITHCAYLARIIKHFIDKERSPLSRASAICFDILVLSKGSLLEALQVLLTH